MFQPLGWVFVSTEMADFGVQVMYVNLLKSLLSSDTAEVIMSGDATKTFHRSNNAYENKVFGNTIFLCKVVVIVNR